MDNCKSVVFLKSYLDCLGIKGYSLSTSTDDMGFLIKVEIPKINNEKIGILKGKKGQNLQVIKKALRIIGFSESKNPYLVVTLVD